jgi:putative ABC transport system permease protein
MTFWQLIRRNLRFHSRAHLGVVLGAAIGSAALIGALVVGDSVRESLRQRALERIGAAEYLLEGGDRLFSDSTNTWAGAFGNSYTLGLHLPAIASARQGASRANDINLYGVQPGFWGLSESRADLYIETNSVLLNEALARQLGVGVADSILLRFRKPTTFAADAPLSGPSDNSPALRLRIQGILNPVQFGDFSPVAGAKLPWNAFVRLDQLQQAAGLAGRANFVLEAEITAALPNHFYAASLKLWEWLAKRGYRPPDWLSPISVRRMLPKYGPDGLDFNLSQNWSAADAGLDFKLLERPAVVELKSPRVFLDTAVVRPVATPNGGQFFLGSVRIPSGKEQMILTYLANQLRFGTHSTPYSMVTAAGPPYTPAGMRNDEMVLNDWLARDLGVVPGDWIEMTYYRPDSGPMLEEATNRFRVHSIVPLDNADRSLMPDFPGIEKAESTRDWDVGFAVDLKRIRPKDEAYWKDHRGTPKAFITLAAGQSMWGSRFGDVTAIRFPIPAGVAPEEFRQTLERAILSMLRPSEIGLRFEAVREQALQSAAQSQDFGQLFLGFSLFLVVAALLLMGLLFQLGLEQRASEVGILLALGLTPKLVRRLLLIEGAALALAGGLVGALGGIGYAKAMLWALTTVWRSAIGGAQLQFHVTATSLCIGICASTVVAVLAIWLTLRKQARRPAQELLAGEVQSPKSKAQSRGVWVALGAGLAAVVIVCWALGSGRHADPGAFFGAGALLLVAGLAAASAWLGRLAREASAARLTLRGLAVRSCARRRKRSLSTIALLACGSFVIVAVGAFRQDAGRDATRRDSGTGGFALIGESTMPVIKDLNTRAGREFYGLSDEQMAGVSVVPLRVREGDIASCLNLNRAQKPRLLGVKPELLAGRFTFAGVAKGLDRSKGWEVLHNSDSGRRRDALTEQSQIANRKSQIPEVPAIGDANAIEWALGKELGDTIDYADEQGRAFKLRLVGAVANSILQGSLLIDEAEFIRRFPGEGGYRVFLIDAPSNSVAQVSATLSRALQDAGLELTPAVQRLNDFNAVQNTYLGTFQILGGLGLLLGSAGLGVVVLRNVLERRGELGLLVAVGFRRRLLQRLVLSEHSALLGAGLGIGIAAAIVAVLPAILSPGTQLPYGSLVLTLAAVLVNGLLWTWLATGYALRGNLLTALRNE